MNEQVGALVEFLRHRVLEDEACIDMRTIPHAALVQLAPGVQVWHSFGATMPMGELHGSASQWVIKTDPKRLHAECDAKRELIALAESLGGAHGQQMLKILAEPYARHPDFKSEWGSNADPAE